MCFISRVSVPYPRTLRELPGDKDVTLIMIHTHLLTEGIVWRTPIDRF